MEDWKKDRIGSALTGTNPTVIARMRSGFAVLGDTQFLPGYCVLIAYPRVASLNDLDMQKRAEFLCDMSVLGDAVTAACHPLKINYEILVNAETFLHAHIFPRYEWEPEERRKKPVWLYPRENWSLPEYQFPSPQYEHIKTSISESLTGFMSYNSK